MIMMGMSYLQPGVFNKSKAMKSYIYIYTHTYICFFVQLFD